MVTPAFPARHHKPGTVLVMLAALLVAACGSSPTTPANASPDPASASTTLGRFSLTFTIGRGTVRPADAIAGSATLIVLGPGGATITGPSSLFGFEFTEIGGNHRHVLPINDGDCAPHRLTTRTPLTSEIVRSGAVTDGPDADWYRSFLGDSAVHLQKGDWDVAVTLHFFDADACAGRALDMRTTVRVHVIE